MPGENPRAPTASEIVENLDYLFQKILTKTSKSVYSRAWTLFKNFLSIFHGENNYQINLPLDTDQILQFISYLNLYKFAPASITTYMSAISFVHKMSDLYDPTATFRVQKILSTVNKLHGKEDSRLPITLFILSRLTSALPSAVKNVYHRALLQAMFTIAFFGLCRIGELTIQPDGVIALYLKQLQISSEFVSLSIIHFKHHKTQRPIQIKIFKQKDESICPVLAMCKYLELRKFDNGPLFCFPDGKPVPRTFMTKHLKACLSLCSLDIKQYTSHSFRIGGASYLASLGLSDTQIRTIGRWDSNAFLRYIRNQRFIMNQSI